MNDFEIFNPWLLFNNAPAKFSDFTLMNATSIVD